MLLAPHLVPTFERLASLLVPGDEASPSATEANVASCGVARVLDEASYLREPLERILTSAEHVTTLADLEPLRACDVDGFAALSTIVTTAYFLDHHACTSIGYSGVDLRSTEDDLDAELRSKLDEVQLRGAIYRPT